MPDQKVDLLTPEIVGLIRGCPFEGLIDVWKDIIQTFGVEGQRELCKVDRFYLLVDILGRADAFHPWIYERCREVEANPDGYLDLWFREGYKSTVITFAGIIQEIIVNPEITVGIFSHTKPVARKFLLQIKRELEMNKRLPEVFPDVFWAEPSKQAPTWSEEKGITCIRKGNPKEATVEAHGLVDGQPTGAHFLLRVYDDVVTRESVSTPEQVDKTTSAWELSDNLAARGPDGRSRAWHVGTRYHFRDTYQSIIDRGALIPRIYPATDTGQMDGKPVFFSQAVWDEKKKTQGSATIATQMLQNPAAGNEAMFQRDQLRFIDIRPNTINIYILCDPASSRKKGADSTAIPVIAVDAQRNKILIDGYHHKMNLQERWAALSGLRRYWMRQPGVQAVHVGYERYGMRSDLEYFEEKMLQTQDPFTITELAWPSEGPGSKFDRIQRLYPDFSYGKFYLIEDPTGETANQKRMRESGQTYRILKPVRRRDHDGNVYSLNQGFLNEFLTYPFSVHDDILDACSRLYDMDYQPPVIIDERHLEPECFEDGI